VNWWFAECCKRKSVDYHGDQTTQPGTGKGKKAGGYVPGTSNVDDPSFDKFNALRPDLDNQYGKGTYDRFLASLGRV
jgi:hypothetical protein